MDLHMFKDICTRCHKTKAVLLINKVIIILSDLQQHVSAEYKGVYTQWHKKTASFSNNCNFFIFNIKKLC